MSPLLYDEVEARRMLGGIGRTKLYRMVAAGELAPVKIGRRTFFAHDDLAAYVDNLRTVGTDADTDTETDR